MKITEILRKIITKVEVQRNNAFSCPVEEQKKYLDSIPEPIDDIERSYSQYLCQMFFYSKWFVFVLNLLSFPLLLLFFIIPGKSKKKENDIKKYNAVFFADGKPESIIPKEVYQMYESIRIVNEKQECITKEDRRFVIKMAKRYPFSWHFLLKCLIKIKYFSYEIRTYNPQAIIVCNEYSFTSSVLTLYCEEHNIKLINVMHGEKLFYIRDSFFRFSECYIWDKNYENLFKQMKAYEQQFRVAVPPSLIFNNKLIKKTIDFTYYLGLEKEDELDIIINSLNSLSKRNYSVAIRPHPRYTDYSKLKERVVSPIEIEGVSISIEESICRTRNAISSYSTVLNQAYHNGTNIIIDDISNETTYRKLRELGYVMITAEHKTLSSVLEDNDEINSKSNNQ